MKDETAVSPVIGVILMVAITVILAAVIAVFGFGFGSSMNQKGPTAVITLGNIPETIGIVDMKLTHKAGDRLIAGDWKLSIVEAGSPPMYITASSDFSVGDQIITTNLTDSAGTVSVTNRDVTVNGIATTLNPDTKYDVKIIVYPYKTMTTDAIVMVR